MSAPFFESEEKFQRVHADDASFCLPDNVLDFEVRPGNAACQAEITDASLPIGPPSKALPLLDITGLFELLLDMKPALPTPPRLPLPMRPPLFLSRMESRTKLLPCT